jgi:hypothetical protein
MRAISFYIIYKSCSICNFIYKLPVLAQRVLLDLLEVYPPLDMTYENYFILYHLQELLYSSYFTTTTSILFTIYQCLQSVFCLILKSSLPWVVLESSCVCMCMYVYVCVCMCMYVYVCVCMCT